MVGGDSLMQSGVEVTLAHDPEESEILRLKGQGEGGRIGKVTCSS